MFDLEEFRFVLLEVSAGLAVAPGVPRSNFPFPLPAGAVVASVAGLNLLAGVGTACNSLPLLLPGFPSSGLRAGEADAPGGTSKK